MRASILLVPLFLVVSCSSNPASYDPVTTPATSAYVRPDACKALNSPEKPLEEESVRSCIELHNGKIASKYQKAMNQYFRNTGSMLQGTLVLRIIADPTGKIESVTVEKESSMPLEFGDMIASTVAQIQLPPSVNGWNDRYTLNFISN